MDQLTALLTFTEDACNKMSMAILLLTVEMGLYPYIRFHITSSLQNDVYVDVCVCVTCNCECHKKVVYMKVKYETILSQGSMHCLPVWCMCVCADGSTYIY